MKPELTICGVLRLDANLFRKQIILIPLTFEHALSVSSSHNYILD